MADLAPVIKHRFFDSNGNPLVGGKLYSYIAGTSTPKATFQDFEGTPNTNPIILDAAGMCNLRIVTGYYKFVLKDANDVTQFTVDKVSLPSIAGNGVPGGGLEGQVLTKASDNDNDLVWEDPAGGIEVVADITARDAYPDIDRYEGLILHVLSDRVNYQLQGGIDDDDWVDITGITVSAVQTMVAGGTLAIKNVRRQRVSFKATNLGGEVILLPNGYRDSDELFLEGDDDTYPCIIETGSNVYLNGDVTFGQLTNRHLIWRSSLTKWIVVGG